MVTKSCVHFPRQLFLLLIFLSQIIYDMSSKSVNSAKDMDKFLSVNFEVYGRVQGVFFRKHTQQQAQRLGLKGYCMNTEKGTVQGLMQGPIVKVNEMKQWLQTVGSPSSKIDKAIFTNEQEVKKFTEKEFVIRR